MHCTLLLSALGLATAALAAPGGRPIPKPDKDGKYTLTAPGIRAQFIPYAATLTNLFVKDRDGKEVDVVLGYDNASYYPTDATHPVLNAIPGRYVNRIGNATFTLDGKTYHTEANDGPNTLHSGTKNWSFRFWSVEDVQTDSITFSIHDPDNSTGMPGKVDASVTYRLSKNTWHIEMEATSPEKRTPLMLTQHTYFNLDAYRNPSTATIWNHTLHLPYSKRYLAIDGNALPTGEITTAAPGSINDFASSNNIQLGHGANQPGFVGNCGGGGICAGYNGYWLFDKAPRNAVVASLASSWNGIKADLRTDQAGVVLYSCFWSDGKGPLKSTQSNSNVKGVESSTCIAIEAQDYPDGINHPEWGRFEKQITGPKETYTWESSWSFSTFK